MYHGHKAGKPNKLITTIRYNKSNIDSTIKSFKNVFVKLDVRRFDINTSILKMLPSTPIQETLVVKKTQTLVNRCILPFSGIYKACLSF